MKSYHFNKKGIEVPNKGFPHRPSFATLFVNNDNHEWIVRLYDNSIQVKSENITELIHHFDMNEHERVVFILKWS